MASNSTTTWAKWHPLLTSTVISGILAICASLIIVDHVKKDHNTQPTQVVRNGSIDTNKGPGTPPESQPNSASGVRQTSSNDNVVSNQPLTPSGTFVSNHRPNLSGYPAPNQIQSVCTTSPGATCSISFTKDGITESLTPETTDEGGSAYWTWKLQDIGLTSGSWDVKAIATLGASTKTATDALNLEVSE